MSDLTVDQHAEQLLRSAATQLTQPQRRECLACYVARMLRDFGCDNTLRFSLHYRDVRAPRASALASRLEALGGFCDCEVFLNGYQLDESAAAQDDGERPRPPRCLEVRSGSTQPCDLWERQLRGW